MNVYNSDNLCVFGFCVLSSRVVHVALHSFNLELRMLAYSDAPCRTTVQVTGGHYFLVLKLSLADDPVCHLCFKSTTSLSAMLGSEKVIFSNCNTVDIQFYIAFKCAL